jgi:hypothetical protein
MLVETTARQAPYAADIIARGGLIPRIASSEKQSATVVIGTRRRSTSAKPPTRPRAAARTKG